MSEKIDRKLKLALDETRLLILGVQIGPCRFEFQGIFQDALRYFFLVRPRIDYWPS